MIWCDEIFGVIIIRWKSFNELNRQLNLDDGKKGIQSNHHSARNIHKWMMFLFFFFAPQSQRQDKSTFIWIAMNNMALFTCVKYVGKTWHVMILVYKNLLLESVAPVLCINFPLIVASRSDNFSFSSFSLWANGFWKNTRKISLLNIMELF